MHLYCLNEEKDLELFHTEVGLLFRALQYRRNRAGLKKLMEQDERYKNIDVETLETMTVMLDLPSIWKERKNYMEKNEENEEEYDMCQAIREWSAEEKEAGRQEGRQEGIFEAFCLLIKDGLLQIEEAAKRSHMSVEDFRARMEQTDLQKGHL